VTCAPKPFTPIIPGCFRLFPARFVVFEAAIQFARAKYIVPAPESAHAICTVIDETIEVREKSEKRVILFNLSCRGLLELSAYDQYLHNGMINGNVSDDQLEVPFKRLPKGNFPGLGRLLNKV